MTDDARRLISRPSHMRANAGRNRQSAAPWQYLFGNGDLSYQTKKLTRYRKSSARRWYRHANAAERRSDRQRARAEVARELDDLLGRDHAPKRGRAAWHDDGALDDWFPDPYLREPTAEDFHCYDEDLHEDECECWSCLGERDDYDSDDWLPETDPRWVEHWLAGADAPDDHPNDHDVWHDAGEPEWYTHDYCCCGPWYCDLNLISDAPWLEHDEQDRLAWYPGNPAAYDRDREHSRHGRRRHGSGLRAVAAGSPPRGWSR